MKHKSTQYFVNLSQFIYFLMKQKHQETFGRKMQRETKR